MGPFRYCERCRCMEVGWNRKYLTHTVVCRPRITKSFKSFVYTVTAATVILVFPTTTAIVFLDRSPAEPAVAAAPAAVDSLDAAARAAIPEIDNVWDPAAASIDALIDRNSSLGDGDRARVARAVVASAREYDVDPYLVASILLVESTGNRFAISRRDAVGLMQIHVPTWAHLVEREGIDLFRVEDNIDLGTRILKDYTRRFGLWEGVSRYLGTGGPPEAAVEYVGRVRNIYSDRNAD